MDKGKETVVFMVENFMLIDQNKCEFYVDMDNSTQWQYFLSMNLVRMFAKMEWARSF